MHSWREEILEEAMASGWLTQPQADALRASDLDDETFVATLCEITGDMSAESARLARLGLGLDRTANGSEECSFSPSVDDGPPEVIAGRYTLARPIGKGGMGSVYEALDSILGRRVAIKFALRGSIDVDTEARLQRERRVLADLDHANLVSVFDAGELPNGQPYFVMRFVEGKDIASHVEQTACSKETIVRLMEMASRAIGAAHRRGVVHRDLKPAHILITPDGSPVVIDFGLSKSVSELASHKVSDRPNAVPSSTTMGTTGYMAPEQSTREIVTSAWDIYALGVILHELLTGAKPSVPAEGSGLAPDTLVDDAHVDSAGLPSELAAIIGKCLQPNPANRYFTGIELADDLDLYLRRRPVGAVTKRRRWYVVKKFAFRHRVVLGIVAVAVVGLLGTWWDFTWRLRGERDIAREAQGRAELGEQAALREKDRAESLLLKQAIDTAIVCLGRGDFDEARLAVARVPKNKWGWECDRLLLESQNAPRASRIVGFHDWAVAAFLGIGDGPPFLSAGQDGRIVAWDGADMGGRDHIQGHWDPSLGAWRHATLSASNSENTLSLEPWTALTWLDEGKTALATSFSGKLFVVDLSQQHPKNLFLHKHPLTAVTISRDRQSIVVGDDQGTVTLLGRDGLPLATSDLGAGVILDVAALHDGSWIVATESGRLAVRSPDLAQESAVVEMDGPVWDVDVSAEERIAVASSASTVRVYQWTTGTSRLVPIRELAAPRDERGDTSAIHAVRWNSIGTRLAAGDDLGRLIVWDVPTGKTILAASDQKERPLKGARLASLPLPLQRRTSSIAFHTAGDRLWTAGHDSTIKEWQLHATQGVTSFQGSSQPAAAFDQEGYLWIGGSDGKLSIHNLATEQCMDQIKAHDSPIASLAVGMGSNLAATTDGASVRFWRRDQSKIVPSSLPELQETRLCRLALGPGAKRLAAMNDAGEVMLWNVETQAFIAQRMLAYQTSTLRTGQLAVNADGTRIAAFADSPTLWLLNGEDLSVIARPYFFAEADGSTIAWHPSDPRILAGGNSAGRVQVLPERWMYENTPRHFRDQAVVSVAFTPDGSRFAAASASGRIVIVQPYHWGPIHSFQSRHANIEPLRQVAFDPSGQRLLLMHQDGFVEVWDSYPSRPPATEARPRWVEHTLLNGKGAIDILFREPCIATNAEGRLGVVCLRATEPLVGGAAKREVVLAEETAHGVRSTTLVKLPRLDERARDPVFRSLAMIDTAAGRWVCYRNPRPEVASTAGELVLLRSPLNPDLASSDSWHAETIVAPGNNGFDATLLPLNLNEALAPNVVHFSHAGNRLLLTQSRNGSWQSTPIARQGDGFRIRCIQGPDGALHAVFDSTRYNNDPLGAIYFAVQTPWTSGSGQRDFLHSSPHSHALSVAIDNKNRPVALLTARGAAGFEVVLVRRLEGNSWETVLEIPTSFAHETLSNLLLTPTGDICFALLGEQSAELRLLRASAGSIREEIVAHLDDSIRDAAAQDGWVGPYLRLDDEGSPIIVLGRISWHNGWLRCWRQQP